MRSQIIVLCLVLLPTVAAITFSGARPARRGDAKPTTKPTMPRSRAEKRRTWHWKSGRSRAADASPPSAARPSRDTADETADARKSGCRFGSSEEFTLFLRLSKQYLKFKAAARKDRRKCKRAAHDVLRRVHPDKFRLNYPDCPDSWSTPAIQAFTVEMNQLC